MAVVRGSGAPVGNSRATPPSVDPALYQNLVEMIPLMERFMDQQGARSVFGHQAPMIYTPAPHRDALFQKTLESPSKGKKVLLVDRVPGCEEPNEEPFWEESENILRRVEGDSAREDLSVCLSPCKDTRNLQMEIEELKQKLWEKDCLLQTIGPTLNQPPDVYHSQSQVEELEQKLWEKDALLETIANRPLKSTRRLLIEIQELNRELSEKDSRLEISVGHSCNDVGVKKELKTELFKEESQLEITAGHSCSDVVVNKAVKDKDLVRLQAQVVKLGKELLAKDQHAHSAQMQLKEHQHGLGEMRLLLEQAEIDVANTNRRAACIEAQLNALRCQVLTLRYQLDAVDGTGLNEGSQPKQDDADGEGPPYRVHMVSTSSKQELDQKMTFLVCVSGPNDEEQLSSISEEFKEENQKVEVLRRQYLAAVIAAREKPAGESFVMVAECRRQLEKCLIEPPYLQLLNPNVLDTYCRQSPQLPH